MTPREQLQQVAQFMRQGLLKLEGRQDFHQLFNYGGTPSDPQLVSACALGCAYVGKFGKPTFETYLHVEADESFISQLSKRFPALHREVPWPSSVDMVGERMATIVRGIAVLNDDHGWKIEQIAEWLETEAADWVSRPLT